MWFWLTFALLGLVVYLPICLALWYFIIMPLSSYLEKKGYNDTAYFTAIAGVVLLVAAAFLFHGGLFGWYDKIEKPDVITVSIDDEVKNEFFKQEEKDGELYLTFIDKDFSEYSDSHLKNSSGYIRFNIKNENAKKERANLKWNIEINGTTYERSTLPVSNEIHFLSDSFALKFGDSAATVKAKNDLGEITKKVHLKKLSTEEECKKAEFSSYSLCKKIADANARDAKKQEEANTKEKSNTPLNSSTPKSSTNNNSHANSSSCDYYQSGRCWDDVIEQAWEDGYMDAYYGGHSYYRDCDGECADIYEEAYERGNYYGNLEYK